MDDKGNEKGGDGAKRFERGWGCTDSRPEGNVKHSPPTRYMLLVMKLLPLFLDDCPNQW